MTFTEVWHDLVAECEQLSTAATFVAPLSERRFRITDIQDDRLIIEFVDSESSRPLPRDQIEALYDRVTDASLKNSNENGFTLENLPRGTEPYAAVLSLHPSVAIDLPAGVRRARATRRRGGDRPHLTVLPGCGGRGPGDSKRA